MSRLIIFLLLVQPVTLLAQEDTSNGRQPFSVVRIHIQNVDFRGEPSGSERSFFLIPLTCRSRQQIESYKDAKIFFEKNKEALGWSNGSIDKDKTSDTLNCKFPDWRLYSGHRAKRGVNNVFDRDFMDFAFNKNRPFLLLVWLAPGYCFCSFNKRGDGITAFSWYPLNSEEHPSLAVTSASNPIQNITFTINYFSEFMPFGERVKLWSSKYFD